MERLSIVKKSIFWAYAYTLSQYCFGEFDQIAMIKAYMWKLAPISKEAHANAISEDYGFRPESLIGLFGCIDLYEKDGVYIVDHKAMTEEQIKILSENLPDDFYYFDEIEQKFAMLFPDAEIELVNGFNLKRLGFVLNTTYAVKNYPSSSSYFHADCEVHIHLECHIAASIPDIL